MELRCSWSWLGPPGKRIYCWSAFSSTIFLRCKLFIYWNYLVFFCANLLCSGLRCSKRPSRRKKVDSRQLLQLTCKQQECNYEAQPEDPPSPSPLHRSITIITLPGGRTCNWRCAGVTNAATLRHPSPLNNYIA